MLDPATVQILFADLQSPIVARSKTNPPQSLSRAASVLARCARLLGLPVHHSVVPEGGKAPEVLPDLAKETEGAPQFARMTADPFLDPQTREAINAVKRPVLVIAGFATEAVVLDAALFGAGEWLASAGARRRLRRNVGAHGGRGAAPDRDSGRRDDFRRIARDRHGARFRAGAR